MHTTKIPTTVIALVASVGFPAQQSHPPSHRPSGTP
jgi:hypothetical protein